jgi:hypothetical protein
VFRGFDFGFLLSFVWVYTLVVFGVKRHGLMSVGFSASVICIPKADGVWGHFVQSPINLTPIQDKTEQRGAGLEMGWVRYRRCGMNSHDNGTESKVMQNQATQREEDLE